MSKIKIKVTVNNEKDNFYSAIYQEDKRLLTYKEVDNTLVKYDYKNNILIRENNDLYMKYYFKLKENTNGEIFIKELNKSLVVNIQTTNLNNNQNDLYVEYLLENDKLSYKIEVLK